MTEAEADAAYAEAAALDAQGLPDAAAARLRTLLEAAPRHVRALAHLGTIDAIAGRHDEALQRLQAAAELAPGLAAIQTNLGNLLGTIGRHDEALAAFDRSLALRPRHAVTAHARGKLLRRMGRPEEAVAAFADAIAWDPDFREAWNSQAMLLSALAWYHDDAGWKQRAADCWRAAREHGIDRHEADFAIAALEGGPPPAIAPPHYVQQLFDRYAHRFDTHLRDTLGYATPEALCRPLLQRAGAGPWDVVDLGCGTGLCAPILRPVAKTLVGVDLSEGMIAQARARGAYDELVQGDLVAHLGSRPGGYDLAVAADVLVYVGDLAPVFAAVRTALRPGGRFGFSVEAHDGPGYRLLLTRRYAHSLEYVVELALAHGLRPELAEPSRLRREGRAWIDGTLFVLRR